MTRALTSLLFVIGLLLVSLAVLGQGVAAQPASSLTKEVNNSTPSPQDVVTYTVTYVASGNANPQRFVTDTLPAGLEPTGEVSCVATVGTCGTFEVIGQQIQGTLNGLEDDNGRTSYDAVVTYNATVVAEDGTEITNTACIVNGLGLDCGTATQGNTASATINVIQYGSFGPVTKSADVTEAFPGDPVTYTITLPWIGGNASEGPAGWGIFDTLPEDFVFDSATCAGTNVTCDPVQENDPDLFFSGTFVDASIDGEAVMTVNGTIAEDAAFGTLTNTACRPQPARENSSGILGFAQPDPYCGSVNIDILPPPPGEIGQVSKSADVTEAFPGDDVTYTITVPWTGGPGSEGSVSWGIVDTLPAEFTYASADCGGTNVTCDAPIISGSEFSIYGAFNDGTVDGEAVITLTGTITNDAAEGSFTNTACIPPPVETNLSRTGTRGFVQPAENCGSASVEVVFPVPGSFGQLTKTADATEVAPGDIITYTITLPYTAGTDPDQLIFGQIDDVVPDVITNVFWTCNGSNVYCDVSGGNGNLVSARARILDPTSDGSLVVDVRGVVGADAPVGPFTNEACGVTQNPQGTHIRLGFAQASNCASVTVTVGAVPGTVTPAPTVPGQTPVPTEPANGTPIVPTTVAPTEVPGQPTTPATLEPTSPSGGPNKPSQPPVTNLPNTGSGTGSGNMGIILLIAALGLVALTATVSLRRSRRGH